MALLFHTDLHVDTLLFLQTAGMFERIPRYLDTSSPLLLLSHIICNSPFSSIILSVIGLKLKKYSLLLLNLKSLLCFHLHNLIHLILLSFQTTLPSHDICSTISVFCLLTFTPYFRKALCFYSCLFLHLTTTTYFFCHQKKKHRVMKVTQSSERLYLDLNSSFKIIMCSLSIYKESDKITI